MTARLEQLHGVIEDYEHPVCWVRIDGHTFALSEEQAYKIAWQLIGLCVDRKHAEQEKERP